MVAVIFAREDRAASRFPGNVENAEDFDVEPTILCGIGDESIRDGSTASNRIRGPYTHTNAAEELSPARPWTAGRLARLVKHLPLPAARWRTEWTGGSPVALVLAVATIAWPKTLSGAI